MKYILVIITKQILNNTYFVMNLCLSVNFIINNALIQNLFIYN